MAWSTAPKERLGLQKCMCDTEQTLSRSTRRTAAAHMYSHKGNTGFWLINKLKENNKTIYYYDYYFFYFILFHKK